MAKIKLIFFLFCVFLNAQNRDTDIQRIDELKKLGDSLFKVSNYTDAAKVYKELVQIDPNSFDFNFKYASAFGLEVEQMPRFKQAKNVREMVKLFERAYELDNKNIGLNRALLEIYLRVPRFFGGGDKKALSIIKNIYTISEDEGKKAQQFYDKY
tara:strand:- start:164 stop:628 length:465 start_codon:yes stop_codon:yes gene_type:complete